MAVHSEMASPGATVPCPSCGVSTDPSVLAEAHTYAFWQRADGACPACVQNFLLKKLLDEGDPALHAAVQTRWPLDAEAAFGALPTPLRLHADPRFTGRGTTLALLDSAFYPHPDLTQPRNRIRVWLDATREPLREMQFSPEEAPRWPGWDAAADSQWHGTMTSVVAAGNGFRSRGLYRGLASEADLVLIQVRGEDGYISDANLLRALGWLRENAASFGVRVVSMSVSGDAPGNLAGHPVDAAVAALIEAGVSVVAAAGNSGERRLIPPATAPLALTIGGLDDHNTFTDADNKIWHSNYGSGESGVPKPELVAPSIWVAAPVLPGTYVAREAEALFARRLAGDRSGESRIAELKLITPHYQHAEGTSFAAPITAGAVACIAEANPRMTPLLVREVLISTAHAVPGASRERQGAGALDAGRAVARALLERHAEKFDWPFSPRMTREGIVFALHDHTANSVEVFGSWNGWTAPQQLLSRGEAGLWQSPPLALSPGRYAYKFLLDGARWLDDPANPAKAPDGSGGLNSIVKIM